MPVAKLKLRKFKNKKIALLGYGMENKALLEFLLSKNIKCEFTICDQREHIANEIGKIEIPRNVKINLKLGVTYNERLHKFNYLFRSPGWPLQCDGIQAAMERKRKFRDKIELTSPMRLFFELCPSNHTIGVTGTNGKGSTASLISHILDYGFNQSKNKRVKNRRVYLCGNIGVAPFTYIDKIRRSDWVVLELSSFQLEDMKKSPHIAVITNFTKDHLSPADPNNPNYHATMRDYWRAKANIFGWQTKADVVLINERISDQNFDFGNGRKIYFGKSNLPSKLPGDHNKENIEAAVQVAEYVKVMKSAIPEAIAEFNGLEHRLEFVIEKNKIKYYNDSYATTPDSTITAINAFSEPIILFLGGAEKGNDFTELAIKVAKRVRYVILFEGKATQRLETALQNAGYNNSMMEIVKSMEEGVRVANEKANSGDVIVMSPACASFGMFNNYKERGKLFKKEVLNEE